MKSTLGGMTSRGFVLSLENCCFLCWGETTPRRRKIYGRDISPYQSGFKRKKLQILLDLIILFGVGEKDDDY